MVDEYFQDDLRIMYPFTPIPFTPWLSILVALLPGVFWLSLYLSRTLLPRPVSDKVVAPYFFFLWLLGTHVCATLAQHFYTGLILATFVLGVTGMLLRWRIRDKKLWGGFAFASRKEAWDALAVPLAAIFLIAPAVVLYDFHDKLGAFSTHFGTANQVLNGIYPPRDNAYPSMVFAYHYGIDVMLAIVAGVFRLPLDWAMDILTALSWGYFVFALEALIPLLFDGTKRSRKSKTGARGYGLVAAMAGGIPWITTNVGGWIDGLFHIQFFNIGWTNPPMTSYAFQHAWTLGFPIFASVALAVAARKTIEKTTALWLVPCILVLSFSNATLFVTMGTTLLGVAVVEGYKQRNFAVAGLFFSALLASFFTSDFFLFRLAPRAAGDSVLIVDGRGIHAHSLRSLMWIIGSTGPLLFLAYGALKSTQRLRLFLGLLAGGSLFVLMTVRYRFSWDTAKFGVTALLPLGVLAAGWIRTSRWHVAARLALALLVAGESAHFCWRFFRGGVTEYAVSLRRSHFLDMSPSDYEAIHWLRQHIRAGEMIYVEPGVAMRYSILGGFPQIYTDWSTDSLGYPVTLRNRRQRLLASVTPPLPEMQQENVRYLVGHRSTQQYAGLEEAAAQGRLERVVVMPLLTIYRSTHHR